MARYRGPRERIERRIGERLGLKGERSQGQKSALTRRPYPPGVHGKNPGRKPSEYSQQLKSKQKVRNIYRLMEKQFKSLVKSALNTAGDPYGTVVARLEMRLDNIVFRLGLAQSRDQARQVVSHGHITVAGRRSNIPSRVLEVGDQVAVRQGSKAGPFFATLAPQWLKGYQTPDWLDIDKDKMAGTIKRIPTVADSGLRVEDLQAIIELYSR